MEEQEAASGTTYFYIGDVPEDGCDFFSKGEVRRNNYTQETDTKLLAVGRTDSEHKYGTAAGLAGGDKDLQVAEATSQEEATRAKPRTPGKRAQGRQRSRRQRQTRRRRTRGNTCG